MLAALTGAALLASGAIAGAVPAAWGRAHEIHSSVTEIVHDRSTGAVSITVRLFADDLAAVLGPSVDGAHVAGARSAGAAAVLAYLARGLRLTDRRGRPLALAWVGATRVRDVLTVSLRAAVPEGLGGVTLRNAILTERFADQVNIVRVTAGARRATTLFTRGDGAKRLH